MHLRKRPSIKFVLESFPRYLRREIDINGLVGELGKADSLLENDIPKPVQEAVRRAYYDVERMSFTCPEDKERDEVGKIWREVDEVIARHIPPIKAEDGG